MGETEKKRGIGEPARIPKEKPVNGVDFKSSRLLFIILVVGMVVAVIAARATPQRTLTPAQPPSEMTDILLSLLPWLLVLLFVYFFFLRRLIVSSADIQANNDAAPMIQAGELASAAELLDGLLERSKLESGLRATALYNRGYIHLLKGEVETALALTEKAEALLGKSFVDDEYPAIFSFRCAMCLALMGNIDTAEKRLLKTNSIRPTKRGLLLIVRALIALRRGDFIGADRMMAEDWRLAEGVNLATEMKALRVLRAFALNNLESSSARRAAMTDLIAGLYPYEQGEFDYLAVKWPELKAFLVEQKLSAAA